MDQETKERWVAALRSGEYEQGQQYLIQEKEDGSRQYCCLGVLCSISPDVTIDTAGEEDREDYNEDNKILYVVHEGVRNSVYLPERFSMNVGIDRGTEQKLASMNDGEGDPQHETPQTFAQIADWIEANL